MNIVQTIIEAFIRDFELRGSWMWACKQMAKGKIVRCKSFTGTVKYRFSTDHQHRIESTFVRLPEDSDWNNVIWNNAIMFMCDFYATDWTIVKNLGGKENEYGSAEKV